MKNRSLIIALASLLAAVLCGAVAPNSGQPESAPVDPTTLRVALAEERERAAAIEREILDLAAQQSMANSAKQLLQPSWAQVWIAGFGTAGLIISLAVSVSALKSTQHAIKLQQQNANTQLRAYLGVDSIKLIDFEIGKQPVAHVTFKNYGTTPATNVCETIELSIQPVSTVYDLTAGDGENGTTVHPGAKSNTAARAPKVLTDEDILDITERRIKTLVFCGSAKYESLGGKYETKFAAIFSGHGNDHRMISGHNIDT